MRAGGGVPFRAHHMAVVDGGPLLHQELDGGQVALDDGLVEEKHVVIREHLGVEGVHLRPPPTNVGGSAFGCSRVSLARRHKCMGVVRPACLPQTCSLWEVNS